MDELNRFKTEINLAEYAQSFGFQIDRKKSTKTAPVLVDSDGNKIVIGRGEDGHYIYFNPSDDRDRGSIIDFVQRRTRENLGQIRKRLREWANYPKYPIHVIPQKIQVEKSNTESMEARHRAAEEWAREEKKGGYINYPIRSISAKKWDQLRRDGLVALAGEKLHFRLTDANGKIVGIETRDRDGRNARIGKGQKKGLFVMGEREKPHSIVITEAAIDAISASEMAENRNMYVSIGGAMGKFAAKELEKLLQKAPKATIVIATDNDEAGERIAKQIQEIAKQAGKMEIVRARPKLKDLNDDLRVMRQAQKLKEQAAEKEEIQKVAKSRGRGMPR